MAHASNIVELSAPQEIFLNKLDTKFIAYVGGYGCMEATTRIWTEKGLIPIADLTSAIRVVSWNEKDQRFQLSLSGGSFPKGRANLIRISTQQGEFVASEHHRTLSSSGEYVSVGSLCVGDELSSSELHQYHSKRVFDPLLSPGGDQRYSQRVVDWMERYATSARQYGQQFLQPQAPGQESESSLDDVQGLSRSSDWLSFVQELDAGDRRLKRNHPDLYASLLQKNHLEILEQSLSPSEVGQGPTSFFGRIYGYLDKVGRSVSRFLSHHNTAQCSSDVNSLGNSKITAVTVVDVAPYYDIQVLNTNNYVCENGFIHHNSGKTFVLCLGYLKFAIEHPGILQAHYSPTYKSIKDVFYPTMTEAAQLLGYSIKIRRTDSEVDISSGSNYLGTIICRSMDKPENIVGYQVGNDGADELDTLKMDKARDFWRYSRARNRLVSPGVDNRTMVATTPEGFRFVHASFADQPTPSYSMVQSSSFENQRHLPPDYISTLQEIYPAELVDAYINGQFVNLTSGTVYKNFDRGKNDCDTTVISGEPLHIGMDFNVGNMSAVVFVLRNGNPHAVDEFCQILDTPEMINKIKERYPNHALTVYPDSSGKSRKSNDAQNTDISLLNDNGLYCLYNATNPIVKDRVAAKNAMFCSATGNRRCLVNTKKCPTYTSNLEQQAYDDNGEPDKSAGNDHLPDAGGYYIAHQFPIVRPITQIGYRW